jgi:hypothetical protein
MKIKFLIIFVSTFFFYNCSTEESETNNSKIIYENKFESQKDLNGFEGLVGLAELVKKDLSPQCGKSSLKVSGGCISPHLTFSIYMDDDYTISAGALVKGESDGCGQILLSIKDTYTYINIPLGPKTWTFVRSDKTLDVKKGDTLIVSISSGGFIACTSIIDNFIIESI